METELATGTVVYAFTSTASFDGLFSSTALQTVIRLFLFFFAAYRYSAVVVTEVQLSDL